MSTDKERFKSLCLEVLPLINGIMEAIKRNGYEAMSSLTMSKNEYFSFGIYDTGWSMVRIDGGPVKIHYEYSEEIQLQEKAVYNKVSENLVEISLAYANLQAVHEELSSIDSITWKQLFVQWANDFEKMNTGTDWDQNNYLEEIEKFARCKILEYAGLEG